MTTHRTLTWRIPGTPEQILRDCQDPDLARRRAECDATLRAHVSELVADAPDGAILVLELTGSIPDSWIPAAVTSQISGTPGIIRREAWYLDERGDGHALVTITLRSIPATTISAAARLTADGPDTSTLTYQLDLTVSLPLLGSTIERAVLGQVGGALDKEAHVIQSR